MESLAPRPDGSVFQGLNAPPDASDHRLRMSSVNNILDLGGKRRDRLCTDCMADSTHRILRQYCGSPDVDVDSCDMERPPTSGGKICLSDG